LASGAAFWAVRLLWARMAHACPRALLPLDTDSAQYCAGLWPAHPGSALFPACDMTSAS